MVHLTEAAQNIAQHLGLPVGLAHTFTKPMIAKAINLEWQYDFKRYSRTVRRVFADEANYTVTFSFEGCNFEFKATVDKQGSGFSSAATVVFSEFRRKGGPVPQSKQYRMATTNINNLGFLNVLREIIADLHFYGGDYPEVTQCWVFVPFGQHGGEIENFAPEFFGAVCFSREQAMANAILLSPYLGAFLVIEFQEGKLIRSESVWADTLMEFKPHRRVWMKALKDVAHFIDKRGFEDLA